MNNWLQAFAVLGCVMGLKHRERCSELLVILTQFTMRIQLRCVLPRWYYGHATCAAVLAALSCRVSSVILPL